MIYTCTPGLPDKFTTDKGLNLCYLWFMTKYGVPYCESTLNNFESLKSIIKVEKVPSYKVTQDCGEILNINETYYVGDGFGRITYSPCGETEDSIKYTKGYLPIKEKYFVTKV